jgi:hypothetical protein
MNQFLDCSMVKPLNESKAGSLMPELLMARNWNTNHPLMKNLMKKRSQ